MSAGVVNLQAQVESVLGALVKAATVELTKLFESRYQASAVDVGLRQVKSEDGSLDKRSIGVQVDDDGVYPLWGLAGMCVLFCFCFGPLNATTSCLRPRLACRERCTRSCCSACME